MSVKLGEMPAEAAGPRAAPGAKPEPSSAAGMAVRPLDSTTRQRLDVLADVKQGVVVVRVEPGSPAARGGIRPGDVILELDGSAVDSPQKLAQLWSKARDATAVVVLREGRTFYAALER